MPDPYANYRFEYVSGLVHVLNDQQTAILVTVMNLSNVQGYVRAFGYEWDEERFDSRVAIPGGFDGHELVEPGRLWEYEYVFDGPGNSWWVRIDTSSDHLVPSVNFVRAAGTQDIDISRTYAWVQPGDFAVFSLPFRVFPPVPPVGPAEGGAAA